jgi:hypothetical protein
VAFESRLDNDEGKGTVTGLKEVSRKAIRRRSVGKLGLAKHKDSRNRIGKYEFGGEKREMKLTQTPLRCLKRWSHRRLGIETPQASAHLSRVHPAFA